MITDLTPYFQQAEQYLVQYGTIKSWRIDMEQVTESIREYCSGGITWDSSAGETWASISAIHPELNMIACVLSTLPLVILTKEYEGAIETLNPSKLVVITVPSFETPDFSLSADAWTRIFRRRPPHPADLNLEQFTIKDLWWASD